MFYQTAIPVGAIDEDELQDLVNRLATIAGKKIDVEKQFLVSTDDENLSSMLQSLADAIQDGDASQIIAAKKNGHKKITKATRKKIGGGEKKEPTRGPHVRSIKVNGTEEMISRFELNRRLQEHAIEPGTELHSPKYGKIIVQADRSESMPYMVVNASGEIV